MNKPFKKLALAVTFSPNAKALLKETKKLKDEFESGLILIHAGKSTPEKNAQMDSLLSACGYAADERNVIWEEGDPAEVIRNVCLRENVDLLVAGALEKEKMFKYYIGSVARNILRQASFSVLIFTAPSENPKRLNRFCVEVDFSTESELTAKKAYEFALLEKAESFNIIREFQAPGLAMTVQDSGSTRDTENMVDNWQQEEETKMSMFLKELNLKGIPVNAICRYGRKGWEATQYMNEKQADILVVTAPRKKLGIIDRIFQHDLEFIFKKLPATFLIVRS